MLALAALATAGSAAEFPPAVHDWLARQTNLQTWHAQIVQTRTLKSLSQPVTNRGQVWFRAPRDFRWEIGAPARTIALRQGDELFLVYPALERVETYPLAGPARGPWRDSLTLLEAGFPRTARELQSQFLLQSAITNGPLLQLSLEPRTASARRWMPRLEVTVSLADLELRATELHFADGSRLRNDFTQVEVNPTLAEQLFRPQLPASYQRVTPVPR